MRGYYKWVGLFIGWASFRWAGMVTGLILGTLIDVALEKYRPKKEDSTASYLDFGTCLVMLSAAVIKADGKVENTEISYAQRFFHRQFGSDIGKQMVAMLYANIHKPQPIKAVCARVRQNLKSEHRLQLVHLLFGIAKADGQVDQSELNLLGWIAGEIGLSIAEFEAVKALFYKDTGSAYKVLEIDEKATDAAVKKAFRAMAMKYHPDRVAALGEAYQKSAQERFQKVQEAYEQIKKERNMN